ncbi:hypothetical protein ACFYE9_03355 [Rhizobium leguminosarum]
MIATRRFFYRFERIDQLWSSRRGLARLAKTSAMQVKLQFIQAVS